MTTTTKFPAQKKLTSTKGKKFCTECFEAAINLTTSEGSPIMPEKDSIQTNMNLYNDILDETDVERVTNPLGLEFAGNNFPNKMQHFPISNSKIDLLFGEGIRRRFDWLVYAVNHDAISEKEQMIKKRFNETILKGLFDKNLQQNELEEEIKKIDKWSKFEAQDFRERRAQQYLDYLWREQDIKGKTDMALLDAFVGGFECYNVDIAGTEPVVRRCNLMDITILRSGHSPYIDDADIIIEETYQPIGWVIDHYYNKLTDADIKKIESGNWGGEQDNLLGYSQVTAAQNPYSVRLLTQNSDGSYSANLVEAGNTCGTGYQGPYDEHGNVYVGIVTWRSMRKIGNISWTDETGEKRKRQVDENYIPNTDKGEEVEWFWIEEAMECHKIGENVYPRYGVKDLQYRRMGNLSSCGLGYVGTMYNAGSSKAMSLMDRMKPYNYLYDILMYRLERAFAKSHGKIGKLPLHKIPKGWNLDTWLYYATQLGWAVEDLFSTAAEGPGMGKIAGNLNESSPIIDMEMGNYIQQHIMMLGFIENQLGRISGITDQREGQVDNRETLGGVERAVTQSSFITEKWFSIHENTIKRLLYVVLETAKYAWRNRSNEKVQYISDEFGQQLFEIDGSLLADIDFGITISNASEDKELFQAIRGLAQAGLQNDKINFSTLCDIYSSRSISSVRRKIEKSEEEFQKRIEESQKSQNQALAEEFRIKEESEQADRDLKDKLNVRDNETKLIIASNSNNGSEEEVPNNAENEKLRLQLLKIQNDFEIAQKKLKEAERHNRETEKKAISKSK